MTEQTNRLTLAERDRPVIEITPAMIEAGVAVLSDWIMSEPDENTPTWVLDRVAGQAFAAMESRRKT